MMDNGDYGEMIEVAIFVDSRSSYIFGLLSKNGCFMFLLIESSHSGKARMAISLSTSYGCIKGPVAQQ